MNEICDCLECAFDLETTPYIKDLCRASRNPIVLKIGWWVQGMFEIIEELINNGYMPKDDEKANYLFNAIGLLEKMEQES